MTDDTAMVEDAILRRLDRGWTGFIDLVFEITDFDPTRVFLALTALHSRGLVERDPASPRYRIAPEQIPPEDLERALGDR